MLIPSAEAAMSARSRISCPRAALFAALLGASGAALAQVTVTDPWVRGTVAGQRATGAFMTLTAASATTLVGAASPVAKIVEIHEMAMDGGVAKMRAVQRVDLPAGKPVALKPGGYHVMLMALQQPLKEGESVRIALTFQGQDGKRTTTEIAAPVRGLAESAQTR
jgi:copper(I)-binding protein